jgi:arginine deiminase
MFCPECRFEYELGMTVCPDCGVPLVSELPPEAETEFVELVTVLTTADAGVIAMAKSILEDAGIESYAKGEKTREMFAAGFVQIQVHPEDAAEAKSLLEDWQKGIPDMEYEDDTDDEEEEAEG